MRKIILLLLALYSAPAFAQLYYAKEGFFHYYAEIKNDSARVEVFLVEPYQFIYKKSDELLFSTKSTSDTIFSGKENKIVKTKNRHALLTKVHPSKKYNKARLEICEWDNRDKLRKQAYSTQKSTQLRRFEDSLSGPAATIYLNVNSTIRGFDLHLLSYSEYVTGVDKASDSLRREILKLKDPAVEPFYRTADSLSLIDSTRIYNLLSTANYKFFYGQFFLHKVALQKPELLIRYIDKSPPNKTAVLRAIRNHVNYKEIVRKVKDTPVETKGKKKIVKQKTTRVVSDVAAGTVYVTIILAELALVTLLAVWVF